MAQQGDDSGELSRKQRREQAREQRKAQEAAEAARAARKRRLSQLGAVAVVVAVAIVVIVLATSSKNPAEAPAPQTKAARSEALSAVEAELKGVPQSGNVLGKPNAPVTMQYFGDLECPICREFTLGALPGVIQSEVRSGKLKIEYRSMSTATGNAERTGAEPEGTFTSQQVAALAAGRQNLGWYYIELFYHEQGKEGSGYVTESFIQSIAQQVPGLDLKKWSEARSDEAFKKQIIADEKAALSVGFEGTPSFMLGKTGGKLKPFQPESLEQSSAFEPAIDKLAS